MISLLEEWGLMPDHQFGFLQNYSTIEKVHHVTDDDLLHIICYILSSRNILDDKKYYSAVFLDVIMPLTGFCILVYFTKLNLI